MSYLSLDFIGTGYSRKTDALLNMLGNDSGVLTNINYIIGDELNQFVPVLTGALRRSMYADRDGIHWFTPYAHYQYMGIVYAVNFPKYDDKHNIIGWKSKAGVQKYPTARILGTPGFYKGWRFGYTTPNTSHHWDKFYTASQWTMGSSGVKADTNRRITAYLKTECKKRGLTV